MKYHVEGSCVVSLYIDVEADSREEALEIALDQRCDLDCYAGNGGMDKLIGVDGDNEGILDTGEIRWDYVVEEEEDDDEEED